jgi:hypothetical protein
MRLLLLAGVASLLALAGCGPDDDGGAEGIGTTEAEIVNGEADAGDPAVVALTAQGQVFCTATLITPSVVLTAAHCLPPNLPIPTHQIAVRFGDGTTAGELIEAHDSWAHPSWNDSALYDDIGLLQMKAVASVAPVPRNTLALATGTPVRIVGFGVTSEEGTDSGVKRMGSATVEASDGYVIELAPTPSSTCYGDSGGPTFAGEAIAGVHSRGSCGFSSIEMSVDAYAFEIDDFLATHPDPACGADGLCAGDCAAAPDPDCPCASDGHCTAACPDGDLDEDCAVACGPNGSCNEACSIPDPDCVTCEADGRCVSACDDDPDCCDPGSECCDATGEGSDCAEQDEEVAVDQGCGCRAAASPRAHGWWAAALALTAACRCRRRGPRRDRPAAR